MALEAPLARRGAKLPWDCGGGYGWMRSVNDAWYWPIMGLIMVNMWLIIVKKISDLRMVNTVYNK